MARKKYIWGGHTYLIADEDLKLYPGAELAEGEKKAKKSSRPTKAELAAELTNPELYDAVQEKREREAAEAAAKAAEEPAEDEKKEADAAAKAAEEPKNKARNTVKNKTSENKEK